MAPEAFLDRDALLRRVAYNRRLLVLLLDLFHQEAAGLMEKVRQAVRAGDAGQVHAAAHALKGTMHNFTEGPAYQAALRLEEMGNRGDLAGVEDALADLESAFPELDAALLRLARELR